jgi:hypothetical protein
MVIIFLPELTISIHTLPVVLDLFFILQEKQDGVYHQP